MSDEARGALGKPQVVIPNLNWRYSGVTATNRALHRCWRGGAAPPGSGRIARRAFVRRCGCAISCCPAAPAPPGVRIWHARRNVEMIIGLVFKRLGFRLGLVFTSAAQRQHTWITRA